MSHLLKNKKIVIIGAGLVGTLLSIYLARKGHKVEVFEAYPDPSKKKNYAKKDGFKGTSINLALSARGIQALKELKIESQILNLCIPIYGRMIHLKKDEIHFQPYGLKEKSEAIYSVPRGLLDKTLLQLAFKEKNINFYFSSKLETLDIRNKKLFFSRKNSDSSNDLDLIEHSYDVLFGTDGARSCVRKCLEKMKLVETKVKASSLAYKEISISSIKKLKTFSKSKSLHALHIWPRKNFMLIALPNPDHFFTGTLFMPLKKEKVSFKSLHSPLHLKAFFKKEFPDILDHVIDLERNFFHLQARPLFSIETWPWFFEDQILIMGDAAHGTLPFLGQGMNASFEDIKIFSNMLNATGSQNKLNFKDLKSVFKEFSELRKPNIMALSKMTEENELEMKSKVSHLNFLLKKKIELLLERNFPERFKSKYGLVSFTQKPYKEALERGKIQDKILKELLTNKTQLDKDIDIKQAKRLILTHLSDLST